MRLASASALILSAFALAACTGGAMDSGTLSSLSSLNLPCTLDTCPLNAVPTTNGNAGGNPVPTPTTPTTNTNVGNATNLSSGDKTIALESATLVSPIATGALSILTETAGATNTARLAIDTNAASNGTWPIPKTMDEYTYGTAASGGAGLGGSYKEYHVLSPNVGGTVIDEELQIWHWGNSYATQYREIAGAGDARRQAWSFGGTKASAMQTTVAVTWTGQYGATSKTWNWIDDPASPKTLSANNSWQVNGTSSIGIDFAAGTINGTLTPSTWIGEQNLNGGVGKRSVTAGNTADANHAGFMDANVQLKGTITGNTVFGNAQLAPTDGYISGINPMYAAFFGTSAATEITGAYTFVAVEPEPVGGNIPINNDTRGFVQQSGVFHAQ
jgi:C-lobe and N-lobe beta barrels of Tf-binding protein B